VSTQTVTTTTCDNCGNVKPDFAPDQDEGDWTVLKIATPSRVVVVDVDRHSCAAELVVKLMDGEIGEPTTRVAVGDSVAGEVETKPVLPTRLTNRCPIGATSASQCWDELPRNQTCHKHGTPAGRE